MPQLGATAVLAGFVVVTGILIKRAMASETCTSADSRVSLGDGNSIPAVGFGMYYTPPGAVAYDIVKEAIKIGYRHIDTAQMYENEETVGAALDAHDVPRDEVFLTTKIWHDRLQHDDLLQSLQESVNRLRVDAVDLALIHWPSPGDEVPMEEYIGALAEAKQRGLARHVGVSNFTVAQLEKARGLPGGEHVIGVRALHWKRSY